MAGNLETMVENVNNIAQICIMEAYLKQIRLYKIAAKRMGITDEKINSFTNFKEFMNYIDETNHQILMETMRDFHNGTLDGQF